MRQFVPKYTFSVLFRHQNRTRRASPVAVHPARVPFRGPVAVGRDDRLPGLPARAIGNPRGRRLNELAVCRLFDSGQFEIQIGNCLACAYDLAANGDLAAAGTRFGAVSFPIAG